MRDENIIAITMISVQQGELDIAAILNKCFEKALKNKVSKKDNNNCIATFFDDTEMEIYILEKEKIQEQIVGMANFYNKINFENENIKENVIKQISLSNSIIYFKFTKDERENRTNMITNLLFSVAKESVGLLMFSNLNIYTPEEKLLISVRGASEYEEYHPMARKDMSLTIEKITDKFDKERIKKNISIINSMGLPYEEKMMDVLLNTNSELNETVLIVNNMILSYALAAIAVRLCGKKDYEIYDEIYKNLNKLYKLEKLISSDIKEIFEELREGTYEDWLSLTSQYEYVAIFLWSLSVIEFPSSEEDCDIEKIDNLIYYIENSSELLNKIKIRKKSEILEKADLIARYKWALGEIKSKNLNIKTDLKLKIILKQFEALKFVLGGKKTCFDEILRKKSAGEFSEKDFVKEMISNFKDYEFMKATEFVLNDGNEPKLMDVMVNYKNKSVLPIFSKASLMADYMQNREHLCVQLSIQDLLNLDKDFVLNTGTDAECLVKIDMFKKIYDKLQ